MDYRMFRKKYLLGCLGKLEDNKVARVANVAKLQTLSILLS